jgi:hypothetical protein
MIATTVVIGRAILDLAQQFFVRDLDPGRRRVLTTAGNAILVAPAIAMGYGALVQRTNFQLIETDIPVENLPPDLEGLRILQLSDIHLGLFLAEDELARVIDAANETKPHVAAVTGDLITAHGDPLELAVRQIARLRAEAGVFGCMGNHECVAFAEARTERLAARAGIRFLRMQAQALRFGNATLNVAGTDYQPLRDKKKYLEGADRLVAQDSVNILLSHNPDVFPVAARQGYNLLLAGHTHGGQVTVEILDQTLNPARFFTPYVSGMYRLGSSSAYVTRGIGTVGVPVRIGAPPEISLLRLRKV